MLDSEKLNLKKQKRNQKNPFRLAGTAKGGMVLASAPGAPTGKAGQQRLRAGGSGAVFLSAALVSGYRHRRPRTLTLSSPSRACSGSRHPGLTSRRRCLGQVRACVRLSVLVLASSLQPRFLITFDRGSSSLSCT